MQESTFQFIGRLDPVWPDLAKFRHHAYFLEPKAILCGFF